MTEESEHAPLSIRDVSKRYGSLWANRDVTFEVFPRMIVGLLGPNGAGKTTLIRVCAGLLQPDSGTVTIDGLRQSLTELHTRSRFGIVSQDVPFHKDLTVEETLLMQATLYGLHGDARKDVCSEAIENYRMTEFARRRIGVLSTGMSQRVAIACAMLHKPKLLLLDEPTVGLDPEVRHHIWQCLKELEAQGVAMLLTTHYLEEAAHLCRTVHLLLDGSIAMSMNPRAEDGTGQILEREYLRAVHRENEKEMHR